MTRSLKRGFVTGNLVIGNLECNTNKETPQEENKEVSFAFIAGDFQLDTHGDEMVFILDSGASDHIIN